jgi:hypothetical protein
LRLFEANAPADIRPRVAIEAATPTVRDVVRRFPMRSAGRSRLVTLFYELDAGLRHEP